MPAPVTTMIRRPDHSARATFSNTASSSASSLKPSMSMERMVTGVGAERSGVCGGLASILGAVKRIPVGCRAAEELPPSRAPAGTKIPKMEGNAILKVFIHQCSSG